MGFDVMLTDDSDDTQLHQLQEYIQGQPYTLDIAAHTAQEAADQWKIDTGEDVVELLGANPFAGELEVRVKPQWASTDSLRAIASHLEAMDTVQEVSLQADMIDAVNANISTIAIALLVVALALMFISFVLINNTVRLTVYAKRFLIHTMRLVGATAAFIRRPIIANNILQGVVAAFLADLLVWALWTWVASFDPMIAALLNGMEMMWIAIALPVAGVLICFTASYFAANKYISLSYDEMFA